MNIMVLVIVLIFIYIYISKHKKKEKKRNFIYILPADTYLRDTLACTMYIVHGYYSVHAMLTK